MNARPLLLRLLIGCCAACLLPTIDANPDSAGSKQPRTVVYKQAGGQSLDIRILQPAGSPPDHGRPALLFFHGGSWTLGAPSQFLHQAEHFASEGGVALLVQYRLLAKDEHKPPIPCIEDAKSAMRWVIHHAAELAIDPERIGAAGGSAGGHLAAFLAIDGGFDDPSDDAGIPVRPRALVLFNPILDLSPGHWGHDRVGDDWPRYSPLQKVAAGAPPALVMVGSRDAILPACQAYHDAVEAAGSRCVLKVYDGQGHGFFNFRKDGNRYYDLTIDAMDDFLMSLGWIQQQAK